MTGPEGTTYSVKEVLDRELANLERQRQSDLDHAREIRTADLKAVEVALQTVKEQRAEDRETDRAYRETQNNWRGQSSDQAATYATRSEVELMLRNLKGDSVVGGTAVRGILTTIASLAGLGLSLILAIRILGT
jgi:hypothetical protein